jgi:N-dimethylarginine dimethylaminohydrolase
MKQIELPVYVMNIPVSFATDVKNNIWMQEMNNDELEVDLPKALREMWEIYSFLTSHGFVYLLPASPDCHLQDLVYVSNNGIVLHELDVPTYLGSNFSAENRRGEEQYGLQLFERLGYRSVQCPFHFEGEAEMKRVSKNQYIGGYGMRSDKKAFEWMEAEYGIHVLPVKLTDPYLYHLDCSIFPIKDESLIVAVDSFSKKELKSMEKIAEIIPISTEQAHTGLTNSVRMGNYILNGSDIDYLKKGTNDYRMERSKNDRLEEIAAGQGMEVCYFNMEEFLKGGGLLSCMVLNVNYKSYETKLLS